MINAFVYKLCSFTKTIRGRLTIWFAASFLVAFTLFLTASIFIVWYILDTQIDHHLHTVIREVEKIWHQFPENRAQIIEGVVASQGMVVIVMAEDGDTILQTASPDILIPAQHEFSQHLVTLRSKREAHYFTSNNTRFALIPTSMLTGTGTIAVGYSLELLQETVRRSFLVLISLLLFFIILLTFLGLYISKKTLLPVEIIARTAQNIASSQNLKGRIPDSGIDDELGKLTKILNYMLDKLEISFETQKHFFSDAAHTIKTPLATLRAYIENLKSRLNKDQQITSTLSQIIRTIDQINTTVKDLLLLSSVESEEIPKKDKVSLSKILWEIYEVGNTLASEKQLKVNCAIEKNLSVGADKSKLTRAFVNLIDNAVAYTHQGAIDITAKKTGNKILVTFSDTGVGIDRKELKKVFNRFFRGSSGVEHKAGSGLGLSITQAIIKAHSGSITIKSEKNKGTKVIVSLPVAP